MALMGARARCSKVYTAVMMIRLVADVGVDRGREAGGAWWLAAGSV